MNTELIPLIDNVEVERQVVVSALLVTDGILDIVGQIEEQARGKAKDIDAGTDKGRKELASIAYSVSKAKTSLDGIGKDQVADAKAKIKVFDAERKKLTTSLDALRDEIRAPVNEYEALVKAQQANAERIITEAKQYRTGHDELGNAYSIEHFQEIIDLYERPITDDCGDMLEHCELERKATHDALLNHLDTAVKRKQEQAELERLRIENERIERERQQAEREAQIRKEAEQEAQRKADADLIAERRAAEAAAARAEADKLHAEQEAKRIAEQAEADKQAAIEAERKRMQAEQDAKDAVERKAQEEQAAREADTEHRKSVQLAALSGLKDAGLDDNLARKILSAIVKNEIKNVTINY